MMGTNIKHHKHYILPSTGQKRSQAFAHLQTDTDQEPKPRPYPSAKTLSWHLASENSTTANVAHKPTFVLGDTASSKLASGGLNLLHNNHTAILFLRGHGKQNVVSQLIYTYLLIPQQFSDNL
uniref:Uncharacterized protein n=1 Tax=Arundo donax TaxID=35708 RepID=A0A0A9G519_ARUDO